MRPGKILLRQGKCAGMSESTFSYVAVHVPVTQSDIIHWLRVKDLYCMSAYLSVISAFVSVFVSASLHQVLFIIKCATVTKLTTLSDVMKLNSYR